MNHIELFTGDVLDNLSKIESNSIDLVVTSPPYNKAGHEGKTRKSHKTDSWSKRNIEYDLHDDFMPESEYQLWQIEVLNELHRVLKDGGSCFYNHKNRVVNFKTTFPTTWIEKTDFNIRQEIIWDRKSTPSVNSIRFYPTTEKIYWLFKGKKPKYFNKEMAIHKEVWTIPPARSPHPAPMPLQVAEICVLACSKPNDIILDPFMGSGTVGVVSVSNKRRFRGIEISPFWSTYAAKNIEAVLPISIS